MLVSEPAQSWGELYHFLLFLVSFFTYCPYTRINCVGLCGFTCLLFTDIRILSSICQCFNFESLWRIVLFDLLCDLTVLEWAIGDFRLLNLIVVCKWLHVVFSDVIKSRSQEVSFVVMKPTLFSRCSLAAAWRSSKEYVKVSIEFCIELILHKFTKQIKGFRWYSCYRSFVCLR